MGFLANWWIRKRNVGSVTIIDNNFMVLISLFLWVKYFWNSNASVGFIGTFYAVKYEFHIQFTWLQNVCFELKFRISLTLLLGQSPTAKLNIDCLVDRYLNFTSKLIMPFDLSLLPRPAFFVELWRNLQFRVNFDN